MALVLQLWCFIAASGVSATSIAAVKLVCCHIFSVPASALGMLLTFWGCCYSLVMLLCSVDIVLLLQGIGFLFQ